MEGRVWSPGTAASVGERPFSRRFSPPGDKPVDNFSPACPQLLSTAVDREERVAPRSAREQRHEGDARVSAHKQKVAEITIEGDDLNQPVYIETVFGIGYRFLENAG